MTRGPRDAGASSAAPTVGIVSAGAMGSAVGSALRKGGARVVATLAGRSARTARLAESAGIERLPDLAAVVREAEVILSIVPPGRAEAVAAEVIRAAESAAVAPVVADLNAIAPATARRIAAAAAQAGLQLVDGSISGPPPRRPGTTRIYLSGPRAGTVAALPLAGVDAVVVGDEVGAASAVKMSTASVYKGSVALLAQALLAARANGVLEHVLADLRAGAPELVDGVERRLARAAAKSPRYLGEMHEIAAAQAETGLTPALFEAMAEVYGALAESPLGGRAPEDLAGEADLDHVLRGLRREDTAG